MGNGGGGLDLGLDASQRPVHKILWVILNPALTSSSVLTWGADPQGLAGVSQATHTPGRHCWDLMAFLDRQSVQQPEPSSHGGNLGERNRVCSVRDFSSPLAPFGSAKRTDIWIFLSNQESQEALGISNGSDQQVAEGPSG